MLFGRNNFVPSLDSERAVERITFAYLNADDLDENGSSVAATILRRAVHRGVCAAGYTDEQYEQFEDEAYKRIETFREGIEGL